MAHANSKPTQRLKQKIINPEKRKISRERPVGSCSNGVKWWSTEPDVGRVANGVAARVDRLKAIGNGQVPEFAAEAWRILINRK